MKDSVVTLFATFYLSSRDRNLLGIGLGIHFQILLNLRAV